MRRTIVLLSDALSLLETQASWTGKGYALDSRGRQVPVDDPSAVRFCLLGAVLRAEHERSGDPMPLATGVSRDPDDLRAPVAPDAPPHLALALDMLGTATMNELRLGRLARRTLQGASPTLRHLPILLGLQRGAGHAQAADALVRAIGMVALLPLGERGREIDDGNV